MKRERPLNIGLSSSQKHRLFLHNYGKAPGLLCTKTHRRGNRIPSDQSCSLPLGHTCRWISSHSDTGQDLLWNPYTHCLEDHTTQTNTVLGKYEACTALSLTWFKCSCKTSSLLILGTAEGKCWKWNCQSVQRSGRRWRKERKKAHRYRWEGRNRKGKQRGGKKEKKQ